MAKFSVVFFVLCTLLVLQLAASHPADDSQSKEDKAHGSSELLGAIPKEVDQAKQSDEDTSKSAEDVIQVAKSKLENAAQDAAKKLHF